MEIVIQTIVYGLSLYLAYRVYEKYNEKLALYVEEVIAEWPDIPNWLNWTLGMVLFAACVIAQVELFFESLIIWLILLLIVPFLYLLIKDDKIFNFISVITFFMTTFYAIVLFASVDNSRDIIGESFIPNYDVYYTTELVQVDYGDAGVEEKEREIAHINTGNDIVDFILESIFPYVFRISLVFIVILSMLNNISLRMKNKLIKKGYSHYLITDNWNNNQQQQKKGPTPEQIQAYLKVRNHARAKMLAEKYRIDKGSPDKHTQ